MRARAVIGANFGDEGKGLMVDYLCSQGAGMVVRYNGGAQAGHTVITPDCTRHVFSHFGAGTFCNVPTFLSQFFICNPLLFLRELETLNKLGYQPVVYAHPNCLVTTFADMMINQRLENTRGRERHGSCGVGINETIERSSLPELKITMADVWNRVNLRDTMATICDRYAEFRTGAAIIHADMMINGYLSALSVFAEHVHPLGIGQCQDPVFEGAQGLLLDQNQKQFFPHVTRSNTGMQNVRTLCEHAGITDIDIYYVSRTYLTRHGAGPLPGELQSLRYHDDTNLPHDYQGMLRFAPLDVEGLLTRCAADAQGKFKLVLTHCDQRPAPCAADLYTFSGIREDIDAAPPRIEKLSA